MNNEFGGLKIDGNATNTLANAGSNHATGWEAIAAGGHGALGVVADPTTGKLTCKPGVYLVSCHLDVETEDISGTSGDGAGNVWAKLYVADSAYTPKFRANHQAVDRPQQISFTYLVEITKAQLDAGTNYITVRLGSDDASGNDVTVANAAFHAVRLN